MPSASPLTILAHITSLGQTRRLAGPLMEERGEVERPAVVSP